ncbi:type IV pilin protein [Niveibacterium sp.]|uniref:type IV pilin protein n=1 Tax=Niveibacterium sp. TaxID=2017444 RepID=UPI0035B29233
MKLSRKDGGFTLIELMIVLAIISIISAIAIPAYTEHTMRGRRAEARAALGAAAQQMERFYSNNNTYGTTATSLAERGISSTTETGKYSISVAPPSDGTFATGFVLTAAPSGFTDSQCGSLTLDAAGVRGKTAGSWSVNDCWQR